METYFSGNDHKGQVSAFSKPTDNNYEGRPKRAIIGERRSLTIPETIGPILPDFALIVCLLNSFIVRVIPSAISAVKFEKGLPSYEK
jgi:hypothetical protein